MRDLGLLPCPFCGGRAHVVQRGVWIARFGIECGECYCTTSGQFATAEGAALQWNQRYALEANIDTALKASRLGGATIMRRRISVAMDGFVEGLGAHHLQALFDQIQRLIKDCPLDGGLDETPSPRS